MGGEARFVRLQGAVLLMLLILSSFNIVYGREVAGGLAMKKTSMKLGGSPLMESFALRTKKHSGPSRGGEGHRSRKLQDAPIPVRTEDHGPSPGQGH